MPVTGSTLRVEGLEQLQRHFRVIDATISKDLRDGLREAAKPVKGLAELLALKELRRGRVRWWRMRIGVTKDGVYMVPNQRGTKDPRYKRKSYRTTVLPLMLEAAKANEASVRREAEVAINRSIDKWGRG